MNCFGLSHSFTLRSFIYLYFVYKSLVMFEWLPARMISHQLPPAWCTVLETAAMNTFGMIYFYIGGRLEDKL